MRKGVEENVQNEKRRFGIYIVASILLVIICTISIGSCYIMSSINKISNNASVVSDDGSQESAKVVLPKIDEEKIGISDSEEDKEKFSEKITNIAIFGLDERTVEYDGEWSRSDSIMILTIDKKNKKVKLSSILRDTYVDILEYGQVKKDKINHSFAYGSGEEFAVSNNALLAYHAGAVRAIETLNNNFKLDIKDYATLNFYSFKDVVDKLGGVEINLTDQEINRLNSANASNPVSGGAGVKVLTGEQALAYSRNRSDGSDTDRSLRQRNVVLAAFNKMRNVNILELPGVIDSLLASMRTSLSSKEILSISTQVLINKMTMENTRFPVDGNWSSQMIGGVSYNVIADENLNLSQINDFIYRDIVPQGNITLTTVPQ